jgi:hypothetical protein
MEMYGGVEADTHVFLDLGTSWRRVVSFTTWLFYPQYSLDRRTASLDEIEK